MVSVNVLRCEAMRIRESIKPGPRQMFPGIVVDLTSGSQAGNAVGAPAVGNIVGVVMLA